MAGNIELISDPENPSPAKKYRTKVFHNNAYDPTREAYDFDFKKSEFNPKKPMTARNLNEMIQAMENDKTIQIEAYVPGLSKMKESKGQYELKIKKVTNRDEFLRMVKESSRLFEKKKGFRLRESKTKEGGFSCDFARNDFEIGGLVGEDFIPLLGGPFHKQLYLNDYLKQQATAFFAYHHDPVARRAVHIIRDFTLGRSWKVEFKKDEENRPVWDAFCEVNDMYQLMDWLAVELSIYGEIMLWWLPHNQTKIQYELRPDQQAPKGFLPRVRLLDPSSCWEIITYPEDITRVLYYQIVTPTQYQIYTTPGDATNPPKNPQTVPTMKYIYQAIPADQIQHHKINCVSNEKRGRSDLGPVFDYLKRLRDTVNYSIISLQKAVAWSIDTTIEGSPQDINDYISSQEEQGTIPPAGSEFVHSDKVKRQYLSNEASAKGQTSQAFDWCLSMIASGIGIPVSYFGTHLSGGQTRASAIISTEPTAKLFEMRRSKYIEILHGIKQKLFEKLGKDQMAEMEVIFPSLYTQDRSQKIKDIQAAELSGYISQETAAEIVAKELEIEGYNYERELQKIAKHPSTIGDTKSFAPLSTPGLNPKKTSSFGGTGLTSDFRKGVTDNDRS